MDLVLQNGTLLWKRPVKGEHVFEMCVCVLIAYFDV